MIDTEKSNVSVRSIVHEIELIKTLKHKHIVSMLDYGNIGNFIYIVLEHCDGGDMLKLISKRRRPSKDVIRTLTKQLASGLIYLKLRNIVHCDI